MIKIVFMGTPDYATCILEEILKTEFKVPLLVTQPISQQEENKS